MDPNPDNDLQMTLRFADGSEQTFTVLRDHDMRWNGVGADSPLVKIEAEWFHNPVTSDQEEPAT